MYQGILNLNRVVNTYTLDHTLSEAADWALVKSHTTTNPSQKQLVYCVKKQSLKKENEQLLFHFVRAVKENKNGLYPRQIELIQTQSNYYVVFEEANMLMDAALGQMYRHASAVSTRAKIIALLLNICEHVPLQLEPSEFVVSGDRVYIVPHYAKQPGLHRPANRRLFMNMVYAMCFGVNGPEDHSRERYQKWMQLEQTAYDRKDFLAILLKFVDENSGSGIHSTNKRLPGEDKLLYPNLSGTINVDQVNMYDAANSSIQKGQSQQQAISTSQHNGMGFMMGQSKEEEFDSDLINLGVNPGIKKLASQVRQSRRSSQIHDSQPIHIPELSDVGINLEPIPLVQPAQKVVPNVPPQKSSTNISQSSDSIASTQPINRIATQLPQQKAPEMKILHIGPPTTHKSDDKFNNQQGIKPQQPPQQPQQNSMKPHPPTSQANSPMDNLFSRQKSIHYDQAVKPTLYPPVQYPPSSPNPTDNPFRGPQNNSNLRTVYMKKEHGKDETDQIFNTIFASFMHHTNRSEGAFGSFVSKTINLSSKELKGAEKKSARDQFDMLFKAYMSQFDMLHAMLKSFLTYYQGTNMGLVAAYLIARCSVHRKLRLMEALRDQQDLFDTGKEVYKCIDKKKYIKNIQDCLYKDDPNRIQAAIDFDRVLPQTRKIMQPYLGEIDPSDRTQQMTFYYLYCLSKRTVSKDSHNLLLHDCMYILLHSNNEFVYDYSQMPKEWDEAYVSDRKKTIELLMFKVN